MNAKGDYNVYYGRMVLIKDWVMDQMAKKRSRFSQEDDDQLTTTRSIVQSIKPTLLIKF